MGVKSPASSPETLTADLGPITKWLKTKRPDQVVARDVQHGDRCLVATFLRQSGYPKARCVITYGYTDPKESPLSTCFKIGEEVSDLINRVFDNTQSSITAETALKLVRRVKRARS